MAFWLIIQPWEPSLSWVRWSSENGDWAASFWSSEAAQRTCRRGDCTPDAQGNYGRTLGVRHRLLAAGASVAVNSEGDPYPLTD